MEYKKELLEDILKLLNKVEKINRSEYYYQYLAEIIWRLNGGHHGTILKQLKEKH